MQSTVRVLSEEGVIYESLLTDEVIARGSLWQIPIKTHHSELIRRKTPRFFFIMFNKYQSTKQLQSRFHLSRFLQCLINVNRQNSYKVVSI